MISRRDFIKYTAGLAAMTGMTNLPANSKQNVLMIVLDDLNDWTGYLGGHPQALTPNIDRLANKSVSFTNAMCQVPVCNASRTSTLTGLYPTRTGIWKNSQSPAGLPTMIDAMRNAGYYAVNAGKITHSYQSALWNKNLYPANSSWRGTPAEKDCSVACNFDASPTIEGKESLRNYQLAQLVANEFSSLPEQFLMCYGITLPHTPWYVPQEYFDRFPVEDIVTPHVMDGDEADIPAPLWDYPTKTAADKARRVHQRVLDNDRWAELVQGYLAASAYADDCVGHVLDALEASGRADNTLVVLWSDHGFHLGEKQRWGKSTVWSESLRVPFTISVPGYQSGVCEYPVGLIDLYPTLAELLDLPASGLDGRSLVPVLQNPGIEWDYPVMSFKNEWWGSAFKDGWRYTRRKTQGVLGEELYHEKSDNNEWRNHAGNPQFTSTRNQLRLFITDNL